MDVKQLRSLVMVADLGSVTQAAKSLHLVQPAVTRHIRALEQELMVELFERTRHGMTPTDAGQVLIDRARRALQELEYATIEIHPELPELTGVVTVGLLDSLVSPIAAELSQAVLEKYPGITLRILSGYSGYIQQWLIDGDVDLALLYSVSSSPELRMQPLVKEPLWAVAAAGVPLSPYAPISWERLFVEPLILPIPGHGLRALIERARSAIDGDPTLNVVLETNSMVVQKEYARRGLGWTVLPGAAVASDIQNGDLAGAPLDEPAITREVSLALPHTRRMTPATRAVMREATLIVEGIVNSGLWQAAGAASQKRS